MCVCVCIYIHFEKKKNKEKSETKSEEKKGPCTGSQNGNNVDRVCNDRKRDRKDTLDTYLGFEKQKAAVDDDHSFKKRRLNDNSTDTWNCTTCYHINESCAVLCACCQSSKAQLDKTQRIETAVVTTNPLNTNHSHQNNCTNKNIPSSSSASQPNPSASKQPSNLDNTLFTPELDRRCNPFRITAEQTLKDLFPEMFISSTNPCFPENNKTGECLTK
ncbi:hypothetical protein RFI_01010 [Reticulomyxa filosa]|uniref:RanBP2-type domain-containing protein n=1 Tax=Reticulomyxa filosa TaxID=46433 RepID=X6PCV6_RETFI|nr:hypothetical protein RFI_01010 [Reticulomyxa filosa]|eukprot:ETO36051.1 hypothetical protein RFI_01010 [Reticulomyxa filosa]